jgi:hypothetical protein
LTAIHESNRVGNYDVDTALRLLSPRDVYGEDEKGCCLCDCISQVVQQIALFILRVCHYICGDHYWYTNSLATQIVEQYYASNERTPYLDGRVEELYQALALRSNGDGTYADGIRHIPPRVVPEVIGNDNEANESIESIENGDEVGENNEAMTATIEPLTYPIAKDSRAWILLEDGFTYEKDEIDGWLEAHPLTSPTIGAIPSTTLCPNYYGLRTPICPITNRPFQNPYYCVEDCRTYEKSAVIQLFEELVREKLVEETPVIGFNLLGYGAHRTMHFYPNKSILPNRNFFRHHSQPIELSLPEAMVSAQSIPPARAIYDDKIRDIIFRYLNARTNEEGHTLKEAIRSRREELGLETNDDYQYENPYHLNLSHLDLSNMALSLSGAHVIRSQRVPHIFVKSANLKDVNLSNCILIDWKIGGDLNCYFMNSNFQKTTFIDCAFQSSISTSTTFLNSDMKDAKWYRINNESPDQIRKQLKSLGALNTETITIA